MKTEHLPDGSVIADSEKGQHSPSPGALRAAEAIIQHFDDLDKHMHQPDPDPRNIATIIDRETGAEVQRLRDALVLLIETVETSEDYCMTTHYNEIEDNVRAALAGEGEDNG